MNRRILVVLGGTNSPAGALSSIAESRLDRCTEMYVEGDLVLCTGGWGGHFNESDRPHAFYAKNHLLERGVPEASFLEFAISSNTVDDAVKVREVVADYPDRTLAVITSDFHLDRVKLIFNKILKGYSLTFTGAKSQLPPATIEEVVRHEKKSIENILKNGLYY